MPKSSRHTFEDDAARSILSPNELSRLRREFFDRINKINKIFLYSLYLPAGRQVLNILSILSILSKKWDFLYYQVTKLEATLLSKLKMGNSLYIQGSYMPLTEQRL